jgi:hypothetical protein
VRPSADWQLLPCIAELRLSFERRLSARADMRHFIRVLQLLGRHPAPRVEQAIALCRGKGAPDAAAIGAQAERLARSQTWAQIPEGLAGDTGMSATPADTGGSAGVARHLAVGVPAADLARFNRLLSLRPQGGPGLRPDRLGAQRPRRLRVRPLPRP